MGVANPKGYLELWQEVDGVGIELGKNSFLSLRYRFSTESDKEGALGAGFYVPMFEARNVLIRENTMRAYLPCGKGLYLWRTATDPNKFETPDREWTGYLHGDDFTVSREDGWKVFYQGGRLSSITSDGNLTSSWSYDSAGGGSVMQNGRSIIVMEPGPGGKVASFVFGGKSYKVEYGKRPITEMVAGKSVLKDLVPALTKLEFPDGKSQIFEFDLNDEQVPKLTTKNLDGTSTNYIWDTGSHHVLSEESQRFKWTYTVGAIKQEFGLPEISRTNQIGQTESISTDDKAGIYIVRSIDGNQEITHVFKTPGPLYGKVQKVESVQKSEGKEMVTQKYHATYDDTGKLIREVDAHGFVVTPQYNVQGIRTGETIRLSNDAALMKLLKDKEEGLLRKLSATIDQDERDSILNDLSIFYTCKSLEFDKAAALLLKIQDPEVLYNSRLRLALNPAYTTAQRNESLMVLMNDFPDKRDYTSNFNKQ